jgi:tetratricopeptide (TPR) repeat protein
MLCSGRSSRIEMVQTAPSQQSYSETDITPALASFRQGRGDEAEAFCDAILAAVPDHIDALHLLGLVRHQQRRHGEALKFIGAVLDRAPRSVDALNNYGIVLGAVDRHQEALAPFEAALAVQPDHIGALVGRADALARLGRHEEAVEAYEAVRAREPNHLHALNESGGLHMRLGSPQSALACYERALALAPGTVELLVNRGTALRALNRDADALASFTQAAALRPDFAEARWNASLIGRRQGDFASGWKGYEWRWRKADWRARCRNFSAPLWLGDAPIAGRTILLHAEQGFGDTIQFIRYAPLVARLGARVVLECPAELTRLLRNADGVDQIIARGDALPAFDFHCPLLSLPLAFATELATVPANVPYLQSQAEQAAKWRGRLPQSGRMRVGICWAGNREHASDRGRSIPLDRFASILSASGLDFVSLQKEVGPAQAAALRDHGVFQLGQEFVDFADAAAVIAMLDLVISVDTAVAHLAGAMGKAVALLLPFSPDFRWMLNRTDSPWYPTVRLFRQSTLGDWDEVIERLREELAEVARRPVLQQLQTAIQSCAVPPIA